MKYIVPVTITDAMLTSSSVAETDYATWVGATAYTVGQRVIRTATHSVYERLVAGTTATAPESDAVNWVRVSATNRWRMLDAEVGTATTDADTITVVLTPGLVRGLALLDLEIDQLTVTMTVGGDEVYRREFAPIGAQEDCDNWSDYFFAAIIRRRTVILDDVPPFAEGIITIAAAGTGTISIGTLVVGDLFELGQTLVDASIGIIDYSRKVVDDFGGITVAERGFAKRMTLPIVMRTTSVDIAATRLAKVRARPVVWIGSDAIDSLVVYGFVKDWSIAIPGRVLSTCSLEIEGLV